MAEHDDTLDAPGGMDRRTLIKRGAIAGGALVWATPVVSSIGLPTAAGTTEPENGNGPEPEVRGVSYVAFGVTCDGGTTVVRTKIDVDEWVDTGGDEGCERGVTFKTPKCEDELVPGTDGPCHVSDVTVNQDGSVTITLAPGCEFSEESIVKCGQFCEEQPSSGNEATFFPCAAD